MNRAAQPSKRPIIAFGSNSWDAYWQTRQQILSRLASRGWPVVYSTGAFFVWERFGERWNGARWRDRCEMLDGVRVYWPGRWQMRWPRMPAWDNFVVRHHAQTMRRIADVPSGVRPIAYLFRPNYLPYLSAIGATTTIYHADDTFSLMSHWTKEAAAAQDQLVERADLVLASSNRIATALRADDVARVLPNGADVDAFASSGALPCPDDLARIPRPRIAYVGSLNEKVDYHLVHEIARARPGWQWVLVGAQVGLHNLSPANAEYRTRCLALPNVHVLGARAHTELPAYLQHVDVNVMCYRTTPGGWWTDIYPLKLHEYLAVGKPVVASGIDAVREFASVIAIADSTNDWIGALANAIESGGVGTPRERRRVAEVNSWDKRIDRLEAWLHALPQ